MATTHINCSIPFEIRVWSVLYNGTHLRWSWTISIMEQSYSHSEAGLKTQAAAERAARGEARRIAASMREYASKKEQN